MSASTDIKDTTRALIQALKLYLNESLPEDDPNFVPVYLYTSSAMREAQSGAPVEHQYPCVVLEGPSIEENKLRRLDAVEDYDRDTDETSEDYLTYYERRYPRYYHLIFRIILQDTNPMSFLDLQEKVDAFFQVTTTANNHLLDVNAALGSFSRPESIDLLEAAGEILIRDVRVYPDTIGTQVKLIERAEFRLGDLESETLYEDPQEVIVVEADET